MIDTDVITLPTMHADQVKAWRHRTPRFVVRCGRRWGKTKFAETIAASSAIKGDPIGWFAPDYRRLSEVFEDLRTMLSPITTRVSKQEKEIRLTTGGAIDFWTLEDTTAGRGRKYKKVIIDEAAFTDDDSMMEETWQLAIEPTLLDYSGSAFVLSNTNGSNPKNFLWRLCNQPQHGFVEYHAPSRNNPLVPSRKPDEGDAEYLIRRDLVFEALKKSRPPLVFAQEYEARFVDWSGMSFFEMSKMTVNNLPVPYPKICDAVYAAIDTATKTGKTNDGTGVMYFALTQFGHGHPLIILDYEIAQIEGALLETWLPVVFQKLEGFAKQCGARRGSIGAFIEDKASGMVLLQQAARRKWPATAIDSKLTKVGKSERAISVSGYVYQNKVKISQTAFDHNMTYKNTFANHMIMQVTGFRVGSKEMVDDDLLDAFCYGIAIGLGDSKGF
jgi:hypothetical protein